MSKVASYYWGKSSDTDLPAEFLQDAVSIASDIVIKLSRDGVIIDVYANPFTNKIGQVDHWRGKNIESILTEESVPKLRAHMTALRNGDGGDPVRVTELNHCDATVPELPVKYTLMPAPANDMFLLLGKDLTAVAEVQQDLVNTQMALEREYERLLGFESLNRAILDLNDEPTLLVAAKTGKIHSANASAVKIFGLRRHELEGTQFAKHFSQADRAKQCIGIGPENDDPQPVDLQTRSTGLNVTVTPKPIRLSGRVLFLCTFGHAGQKGEVETSLSSVLSGHFERTTDAIVLADAAGRIQSCNQSFLSLCDTSPASSVEGLPMSEFLARGSVDLKIIQDKIAESGQIKNYNAGILSIYGTKHDVSLSVSKFDNNPDATLVFVFRQTPLAMTEAVPEGIASSESVTKLVGSAPLKEIVAGTTDVIEKLCITAALEITNNNKVAAANLLGLSRQSLYEKLRKHNLL